jgi:CheY-like chemotaxis protein
MLGAEVLEDAGFEVVEAGNAEEALSQLHGHPEVRVLLTDIDMPGRLNGVDLAWEVHGRRPDIQVMLVSGQIHPRREQIPDDGKFLAKPFHTAQLVQGVRELASRSH